MKYPTILLLIASPILAQVQYPTINNGQWAFTIGTYTAQLQVTVTGPTSFSGVFVSGPPGFAGRLYPTGGNPFDVSFNWNASDVGVPGLVLTYYGTASADGNSMSGVYGVSPSQTVGSWSARLQVPAAPVQPPAPILLASCPLSALSGTYGYIESGFVSVSGAMTPFAASGRIVADGNGGFAGADSASLNGGIASRNLNGSYTLNSNCTGTMLVFDASNSLIATLQLVVTSGGKTIQLMEVDPGTAVVGTAASQ